MADLGMASPLEQRIGPLQVWLWMVLVLIGMIGYAYWHTANQAKLAQAIAMQLGQTGPGSVSATVPPSSTPTVAATTGVPPLITPAGSPATAVTPPAQAAPQGSTSTAKR
jgi:ABC-type uncharacterized transport system substrate-binding protein